MNDFVKQRKGNDGKNGFQKDLLKDICKGLGISSALNENTNRGKVVSTLESISERDNTNLNSINFDFSPTNQRISKASNFEKNYRRVMEEFQSITSQSQMYSPSNRTLSVDFDQKLKLKALQSQMDSKKVDRKADFSTKLKDLKLNYVTQNSTNHSSNENSKYLYNNISLVNSRIDRASYDSSNSNLSLSKLKQSELISDKTKLKMFDFMKKTKEFSTIKENSKGFLDDFKNSNNKTATNRITKENLMAEFKLFDSPGVNKVRKLDNENIYLQAKTFVDQDKTDFWNSGRTSAETSRKRLKENAKKEIVSLLNTDRNCHEGNKISRLRIIQSDENGISKNNFNLSYTTYLNIDKYPNEIISKMQKKFPDLIKQNSYITSNKNYLEKDKIEKMRSKISKFIL